MISSADATNEVGTVHIRVGTFESGWYTTACGKTDGNYGVVIYMSRHLATCQACLDTFLKTDKSGKE